MFKVIVAICSVLLLLLPTNSAASYFHESPNQQTTFPGWQEPGLWRPRWVLDREIVETNPKTGRLNRDRTVKLCKRPLLQLGHTPATAGGSGGGGGVGSSGSKAKSSSKASASSRGSATTAEEHAQLKEELTRDRKEREEVFSAFGTWSFQDENPLPTAAVRMELREGRRQERIRYESRCQFGGDGYVAKFKRGTVFRYKGSKEGSDSVVPLGKYAVGTFMLRANAHRPVVTKDFMAFQ